MDVDTSKLLGGKWEMSIGANLIPSELLGEISPNYEEGTMEADTQAGTRTQPSGLPETSELTFNLYLPSMDYLKVVFADAYQAPTAELQKTGRVVFGSQSCTTQETLPINLHPTCEETDDNDIFIPAGLVAIKFNPTLSTSDLLSFEGTIYAQPSDDGRFRIGTGDLSQPSYWDVTTQSTKPISSGDA